MAISHNLSVTEKFGKSPLSTIFYNCNSKLTVECVAAGETSPKLNMYIIMYNGESLLSAICIFHGPVKVPAKLVERVIKKKDAEKSFDC